MIWIIISTYIHSCFHFIHNSPLSSLSSSILTSLHKSTFHPTSLHFSLSLAFFHGSKVNFSLVSYFPFFIYFFPMQRKEKKATRNFAGRSRQVKCGRKYLHNFLILQNVFNSRLRCDPSSSPSSRSLCNYTTLQYLAFTRQHDSPISVDIYSDCRVNVTFSTLSSSSNASPISILALAKGFFPHWRREITFFFLCFHCFVFFSWQHKTIKMSFHSNSFENVVCFTRLGFIVRENWNCFNFLHKASFLHFPISLLSSHSLLTIRQHSPCLGGRKLSKFSFSSLSLSVHFSQTVTCYSRVEKILIFLCL